MVIRRIRIANPGVLSVLTNPRKKKKAAKRAARKRAAVARKVHRRASPTRRKNLGVEGGATSMKTKKSRKKRARARRRSNPFVARAKSSRRRRRSNPSIKRSSRRRRNPGLAVAGYKPVDLLKLGAGAAAGAIATRAITQVALRDRNQGPIGYGANVLVALVLGYFGHKVSPELGVGMLAGGLGSTMQRIWDEKVSQTSPAAQPQLQGLGDASYSDDGLGTYVDVDWRQPSGFTALPAAATAASKGAPGSSQFQPHYA